MTTIRTELAIVADRVASRRDAIKRDPSLSTGDSLPRAQLYDHIPELIARYERGEAKAGANGRTVLAEACEGIGLSIVKRPCELLDAAIEIELDANAGTTFRILIPRQYAASVN